MGSVQRGPQESRDSTGLYVVPADLLSCQAELLMARSEADYLRGKVQIYEDALDGKLGALSRNLGR